MKTQKNNEHTQFVLTENVRRLFETYLTQYSCIHLYGTRVEDASDVLLIPKGNVLEIIHRDDHVVISDYDIVAIGGVEKHRSRSAIHLGFYKSIDSILYHKLRELDVNCSIVVGSKCYTRTR